jgi:hypothetical protein
MDLEHPNQLAGMIEVKNKKLSSGSDVRRHDV